MLDDVDLGVLADAPAQVLTARHACFAEVRPPVRRKPLADADPTARGHAHEYNDDRLDHAALHCRRPDVLDRKHLYAERRSTLLRDHISNRPPGRVPLLNMKT